MKLRIIGKEGILITDLEILDTLVKRFFGLMGKRLIPGQGVLLTPCNSIHCFFMKESIDVLFLSESMEILGIQGHLKPWRVSPIVKEATMVVEAKEGTLAPFVQIGDLLELV